MKEVCFFNYPNLKVYYEQLVLHPEPQMRRILDFLELPWNNSVLHHEELIGKDISLSKVERSSDQVYHDFKLLFYFLLSSLNLKCNNYYLRLNYHLLLLI